MNINEPTWDQENDEYYIKVPMKNNQIFSMYLQEIDWTIDTSYFNLAMNLYDKRKKAAENEDLVKTTGKQDFLQTYIIAKKCFEKLEQTCLREFHYTNVVIYCYWTDNRRKDIYYHFLSKRGYRYGRDLANKKCIYKKFKKKES